MSKRLHSQGQFYTIREAAEILRLTKGTIYALVSQRRIGHRKHGSRVVFTTEHLEEFSRKGERVVSASHAFRPKENPVKSPRHQHGPAL